MAYGTRGQMLNSQEPSNNPFSEPNQPNFVQGRSKSSVEFRDPVWSFWTKTIFTVWGFYPPPNPQAGGSLLVGCPRLLIQYIHN